MKVLIKRNPASAFGCSLCEGEQGEVDDDLGKVLVEKGIADCLDKPKAKPKRGTVEKATADLEEYRVKAIPEPPAIAEAKPPEVATEQPAAEKKTSKSETKSKGA